MGIKMDKVRCDGKELKITEYDTNKTYGCLKCYYCNADVSFVNSYEKNLGERKIIVQRYFRLKSGQEHEKGCRYTVDGVVSNIYAACADNELISKQDNKYVVRLMLSSEETDSQKSSTFFEKSGHGKRQHNYIPSGKKIAYLSTMNQIMKLRAIVEDNSDLEDKINLQYRDWKDIPYIVPWKNFYFDSEKDGEYNHLLKYLTNEKVYHPICIVGFVKSVSEYQEQKFCLKYESVSEEKNKRIVVEIYFANKNIYDNLLEKEHCKVIVYTKFKFHRKNEWTAPDGKKFTYYNITGNIYDRRQVLFL